MKKLTDEIPTDFDRPSARVPARVVAIWKGASLTYELPSHGRVIIGRGTEADFQIDHPSVSRRHVELVVGEGIHVLDLGSANGTWVDGKRLAVGASAVIQFGGLVEIGAVLLAVRSDSEEAPATAKEGRTRSRPSSSVVIADPEMLRVHETLEIVARSALPVILLGETGSGKEVLATRVHQLSPRAEKPFLKVNCGALVETLLEAELFGYERGAFTGAVQAKIGLLESADGGTLFLDELGELPLPTQIKLLRVLESNEITRVGGLKPRPINVRFVAATNSDLQALISAGKFRQDLFFRLDGVSIHVPPLRERVGEIANLADSFLRAARELAGQSPCVFSDEAMAALIHHPWPGNVRELKNVVNRTALFCQGSVVTLQDLRIDAISSGRPRSEHTTSPEPRQFSLAETTERQRIAEALDQCVGNQTKAAARLGMSRRTLLNRLDALDFPRPRKRNEDG